MSKIKLYTQSINYANWVDADIVDHPEKANLILFMGGADLNPELYGEKDAGLEHGFRISYHHDRTDERDLRLYDFARKNDIPMLGICRGGQLLTVMAGGKLVQDVEGHAGPDHQIVFANGDLLPMTSLHHQMFRPMNVKHELIAKAVPRISKHYLVEGGLLTNEEMPVEPEIVYYPEINGLAIQGHPEMSYHKPLHIKLNDLIKEKLYGK